MNKFKTTKAWVKAHRTEVIVAAAGTTGFLLARHRYMADATLQNNIGKAVLHMMEKHDAEIWAHIDGEKKYILRLGK